MIVRIFSRIVYTVLYMCMFQSIMVSAQTIDPDSLWYKFDDVPFDPQTMIIADDDRVWFGSETGAWVLDDGNWTQYTTENSELPSNTVQTVAIDSTGAVWFGTSQGAAKLDGDIWTVYTTENSGLATTSIEFIAFDKNDGVWMADDTTLSHFIDDGWDTYSFWESNYYSITTIAVDGNNELWAGTASKGLWNLHGGTWIQTIGIEDKVINRVSSLLTCVDGTMIGAFSGSLNTFDGDVWSVTTESTIVDILALGNKGNIWGIYNQYLQLFHESRRAMIDSRDTPLSDMGPQTSPYFRAIDFDSHDNMWLITDNGLFTYSGCICGGPYIDTAEQYVWHGDDVAISWIASKSCDLDIGTEPQSRWLDIAQGIDASLGIYHFNFTTDIFDIPYDEGVFSIEIISDDAEVDINNVMLEFRNPILDDVLETYELSGTTGLSCFVEDGGGTIWAGTKSGLNSAIWQYDGNGFLPVDMESIDTRYADSSMRPVYDAAIDSNGDAWFACHGGLIHHNGATWEQILDGIQVDNLASGINGTMWALTETNIIYIDAGDTSSVAYPWDGTIDTADVIASSPEGTLFAFKSGRMASFNGETWHYYDDALGDVPVNGEELIWDASGNVCTYNFRTVYSYSFTENTWTNYYIEVPDAYPYLSCLNDAVFTDDGIEWFSYVSGIFRIIGGEIDYVYNFLPIITDRILISPMLIDSTGIIWMGGGDTIKRLDYTYLAVEEELERPEAFVLEPVYPNPFNSSTTIRYSLGETQPVTLTIYSITGQKVCELVSETKHAGVHTAKWNGTTTKGIKAASGIYFARLETGDIAQVQKMLMLK